MVYRKQKSNTYCELRTSDCDCNRVSSQASTNTNPLMLLSQKSSHTVDICRYENQQCRGYTSAVIYSIHPHLKVEFDENKIYPINPLWFGLH